MKYAPKIGDGNCADELAMGVIPALAAITGQVDLGGLVAWQTDRQMESVLPRTHATISCLSVQSRRMISPRGHHEED